MIAKQGHPNSIDVRSPDFDALNLQVFEHLDEIETSWRGLESQGLTTIYQRFDWVKAWLQTIGKTPGATHRFIVAEQDDETLFILPLSVRKVGPVKIVEWLADSHSNFQMGLYSNRFLDSSNASTMEQALSEVVKLLDGADLLSLRCQPERLFGYKNPMAALKGHKSSNPAFMLDISGGFDAALERIDGTKRRKKYRWQLNHINDEKRIQMKIAETRQDAESILQTAFQQMALRFEKLGIKDVFQAPSTQEFFRNLISRPPNGSKPLIRLYALEIDGKVRATLAGGVNGNHFSACFISLSEDELAFISPGQLLIYRVIQDCAARGIVSFDFGRGEERYKRSWTDQEIAMIDVTLPFTPIGRSLAALQRSTSEAKRLVRNNGKLWALAKQVRSTIRKVS